MYLAIEKMTNSWSLLYHTINGTLDEVFPIMTGPIDEDAKDYVVGLSTESHSKWAKFDLTHENVTIDTSNYKEKAEIEKPPIHYK